MIKILEAVNLIKFMLSICLLIGISGTINSQCINKSEYSGYKVNTIFTLDSLYVQDEFFPLLNHSISLLDTFDINKDSTWLYYLISLNWESNSEIGLRIKISLRQGVNYDILFDEVPLTFYDSIAGAFCYNGYTFFVLLNHRNDFLFNKLFITKNTISEFPILYKTPIMNKFGIKLGYEDIIKYAFLFYDYKGERFKYKSTSYSE